jgi:surface protein
MGTVFGDDVGTRQSAFWNITVGPQGLSSLKVSGDNKECQGTPVLKQRADCSLGMLAGRALRNWILEPAKGSKRKDVFTIRAESPRAGCRKKLYIGVPDVAKCKAKRVQMYARDDGSSKQHWMLVPRGKIASPKPKPSKKKPIKKKPTKKPQQAPGAPETKAKYHVRVDTKTKGPSCNEWLTKAQAAYEEAAAQKASAKLSNVWSFCQVNNKRASRASTKELIISLFVKTNNLEVAKQTQADLVKAVKNGDFAEAVKILGVVGFTPEQVSLITPNCIIGFETCKNLYGSKDLLPPQKPKEKPSTTPTCTAGTQYLDSATNTCKACTTSCGAGKYIKTACSATADAVCDACTTSQDGCSTDGTACVTSEPDLKDKLQCSLGDAGKGKYADDDGVVQSCSSPQDGCSTDGTACVASDPDLKDKLQCSLGDAGNGKYADEDGVVQSCSSQDGCSTDGKACVASDPDLKDKLQCSLGDAVEGKYADDDGVVQSCSAQDGCSTDGTACVASNPDLKDKLQCSLGDAGKGKYADDDGVVQSCSSPQDGCSTDGTACVASDPDLEDKLQCSLGDAVEGKYADEDGVVQSCSAQDGCSTDGTACVASDPDLKNKLQCSLGDAVEGKYADDDGVVQSCSAQDGCSTDGTACVASDPDLEDKLQCSLGDAVEGKYADDDGVVQSCSAQDGCSTDGTACVASDPDLKDKLQCSLGDAGKGKYADDDGVVQSCSAQDGCSTDGTACVASDPDLEDKLQCSLGDAGKGKYADEDGVVQSCSSQDGCSTVGTACVASDPDLKDKLQCSLGDAANGKYADDDGVVQSCSSQTNCVESGAACLTNNLKLTCTIANSGYFLDDGEVKECTRDCQPDEVLDKSACTGTTTTNGSVCKVPTPGQFKFDVTDGVDISLPLAGTVNVSINWGDGTTETVTAAGWKGHSYPAGSSGIQTVLITGTVTCFGSSCRIGESYIPGTYNAIENMYKDKLVEVVSFGDLGITSLHYAFYACRALTKVPSSIPSTVTDLSYMFYQSRVFDQDLSSWDVSNVTNMRGMFQGEPSIYQPSYRNPFNNGGQPLNWGAKTANVQNMANMFEESNFNQDISGWNVSAVTTFTSMFRFNTVFNQNISGWDVGAAKSFINMFGSAFAFNQDLSGWNVGNVQDIECYRFNYDNNEATSLECQYLPTNFRSDCGQRSKNDGNLLPCVAT